MAESERPVMVIDFDNTEVREQENALRKEILKVIGMSKLDTRGVSRVLEELGFVPKDWAQTQNQTDRQRVFGSDDDIRRSRELNGE